MINYIAVDEKLRKDELDVKAMRGIFEGSNPGMCWPLFFATTAEWHKITHMLP